MGMEPDMTSALRRLSNAHGPVEAARLLGWHYSTLWRKLNGKSRITQTDELAIQLLFTLLADVDLRPGTRT